MISAFLLEIYRWMTIHRFNLIELVPNHNKCLWYVSIWEMWGTKKATLFLKSGVQPCSVFLSCRGKIAAVDRRRLHTGHLVYVEAPTTTHYSGGANVSTATSYLWFPTINLKLASILTHMLYSSSTQLCLPAIVRLSRWMQPLFALNRSSVISPCIMTGEMVVDNVAFGHRRAETSCRQTARFKRVNWIKTWICQKRKYEKKGETWHRSLYHLFQHLCCTSIVVYQSIFY